MKYIINVKNYKKDQLFRIIKNKINTYGFCILDNVVPKNEINLLKKRLKMLKKKLIRTSKK